MTQSTNRIGALLISAACLSFVPLTQTALAQQGPVSSITVQQFLANPSSLLQVRNISADTSVLVCRDHATLNAIVALLAGATKQQQDAILAGLATCAGSIAQTDAAFANAIQQAVAATNDQPWITTFANDLQNVAIGTAAGAGGGGGGGGGTQNGPPLGGSNTSQIPGIAGTPNVGAGFISIGGGGVLPTGTTGTTTVVSPQ
jgi:hypothetical protein